MLTCRTLHLAVGDLFNGVDGAGDDLVEPSPTSCNGGDKLCSSLGADRAVVEAMRCVARRDDLAR